MRTLIDQPSKTRWWALISSRWSLAESRAIIVLNRGPFRRFEAFKPESLPDLLKGCLLSPR